MLTALPLIAALVFIGWSFLSLIDFVSELFEHSREGER